MVNEEAYARIEEKINKMSLNWKKTLKNSFNDILLDGYKVKFKLENAKSDASILPDKSNKTKTRSF